ncbi:MAG: DUF4337 family protein [Candidatus Eremiobacterota bacterium]
MSDEEKEDKGGERWEILFGIVLAIFAAALAICDLGAGKYGDDEMIAVNDKAGAYLWYQSKGIKETLVEGQANFLTTMIESGAIAKSQVAAVQAEVDNLRDDADRYSKEKKEILVGSKGVGEANWMQDIDGEKGKVTGAKEFEARAAQLGEAGDVFDRGTLYLQMCLVLGAIGIIVRNERMKLVFFIAMLGLGILGSVYTHQAYQLAEKVG